jgi:serine protease Do
LKIDRAGLPAVATADSDSVRLGQLVMAFGSPMGLQNSVTMGVVSAVARQLNPEDPMIYLQTDAPINPGSSGGPLIDTDGRLIGINTLIVSQSGGNEGLGFAAPSNIVRAIFDQIRRTGRVRRGEIGLSAQTITPLMAAGLGLQRSSGVVIADVIPRGPAEAAGVRVGDVILSLDGKSMENARQLLVNLYPKAVGETVNLEILRDDLPLRIPVQVRDRPADPTQFQALVDPTDNLVPRLGILALSLDASVAARLPPLRLATGVVVAASAADVPGARAGGFQPADVIYAVNGERVHSLEELQERMSRLPIGSPVVVQLERRGRLLYQTFAIE